MSSNPNHTASLQAWALAAFLEANLEEKIAKTRIQQAQAATNSVANVDAMSAANQANSPGKKAATTPPGRPDLPNLTHPAQVPRRAPSTLEGRAALVHSIAHIEFNAINLALDAVWRFDAMPDAFYTDWALVAREEACHFSLLREHLRGMGVNPNGTPRWDYGSFEAHNNLWEMCDKTAHDVVARMALVPRTLEARGLDATPQIQARLRQTGAPDALRAVEILDIILRDEIGHVAIGNHWYRWLCARDGLEPVAHYALLTEHYKAPKLRPPFNEDARRRAGFSADEIARLCGGSLRA
jgi:uncharacterized ferritin-like protein (DUF455 family)